MLASVPEHIIARLFLRAVLPALPLYAAREESERRLIEGWRFIVRFAGARGIATTLSFRDGAVSVDESWRGFALRLSFLSDRDVVRAFRRQGVPVVLPWGGVHHLVKVPVLLDVLSRMGELLALSGDNEVSPERRELRAELLLGALLPAAVAELGAHEAQCRSLLAPFEDFVAQLSVSRRFGAWIRRRGNEWTWGRGTAPSLPDVQIEFRDPEVALSAVDGMIDSLAASVTGEIAVRGMIPLADALAQVMERVSECLGQGRS